MMINLVVVLFILLHLKLDSGKIICKKKVKINKKDNPNSLKKKILKQEH